MTRLLWAVFAVLCLALVAVSAKAVQSYTIAGAQPDPMLAVVKIITDKGHGSGFHMGNGHIITAAHVLRGATSVKVKSSGLDVQDAEILWSNDTYDVALISAKLPKRFGTVMIIDGRLRPFAMPLDAHGRWTGVLI